MKTIKHASLILLSSLVLTACGGGGGKNANTQPAPINHQPSFTELKNLPLGEVKGEDFEFGKVAGYNNRYSFHGAFQEYEGVEEIVVDQARMTLVKSFANVGGLQGNALANAFEGVWNAMLKNPERNIFYFGSETSSNVIKNLRGKATYKGNATRYDNVSGTVKNIGKSTLEADFDRKTIKGHIDVEGLLRRDISLKETTISGNQFNGKAVAGEDHLLTRTVVGQYEGKFFGPNADEVAGKATFTGEAIIGNGLRDLDTSFSAEKQPK